MSKYVNVDDYCANLCKCNSRECDKSKCRLWQASTADVKEVIKCKECKFFREFRDNVKEKSVDGLCVKAMLHRCDEQFSFKSNDDYCSYGKRWEKE